MIVGVPVETFPDESRVTLVPAAVPELKKLGLDVLLEEGAGRSAGLLDPAYQEQGARLVSDRKRLFSEADVVLFLHAPAEGQDDWDLLRSGQIALGLLNPFGNLKAAQKFAGKGVTAFSLELLPRISRAQPMDALTSMATIAGYKAVLLAASSLKKIFPMMMTAAGTIAPARVFIVGAGVAGLQAIATARRLGAVVQAYDVRPAVKEQVESLGARFLELRLETGGAEDTRGYAKALGDEFYQKQRELMTEVLIESDVVITTASVLGKKAPILFTEAMVRKMSPGSVVLDLAAEGGGNCELTRPGETVDVHGVTIMGPVNLASSVPYHASQMYARNVTAFLGNLIKEGKPDLDSEDQIVQETLLTHRGEVVHPKVRELLGLSAPVPAVDERSGS